MITTALAATGAGGLLGGFLLGDLVGSEMNRGPGFGGMGGMFGGGGGGSMFGGPGFRHGFGGM